jgi:ABC-type transport system involved in cytochrome c biogenesis permease subunit
MDRGSVAVILSGACLLSAALAYVRSGQAGRWLGAAGAAILVGALAARGLQAGHWPLASRYEFTLTFALGTALAALTLGPRRGDRARVVLAATMAVAAVLALYARLGMPSFKREIRPLPTALYSPWLPLHVGAAGLAYGALAMAGAAGAVWLLWKIDRLEAERLLDRAVRAGYPFLTASMLLGMVWAQAAWGRYWGWDLKEVWTLITWLVYTLYWHLRRRPRWKGQRMAWLALLGLGSVLFTFVGVGRLARWVGLASAHLF